MGGRRGNSSEFFYGPDRDRYKQVTIDGSGTETTVYVGGWLERVAKPSGVIEYKHMIPGSEAAGAIHTRRSNGANDTRYLTKDHLGSIDTISNEAGTVLTRLSYDAFGKRRDFGSGALSIVNAVTHDGFTGHEMLDSVGLIHMNGRVYDPLIGRFLSADPFIQEPLNSQSLNRYSYVMNNPLSLVDPSGYSWLSKAFRKLGGLFNATAQIVASVVVVVVVVVACVLTWEGGGCVPAVAQGLAWLGMIWGPGSAGRKNPNAPPAGPPPGWIPSSDVVSFGAARTKTGVVTIGPVDNDDGSLDEDEEKNLKDAVEVFNWLYSHGYLNDLGYGFIDRHPYTGVRDKAMSVKYERKLGPLRPDFGPRARELAHIRTRDYSGATVFRNGALTLDIALETLAHERWHLEPANRRLYARAYSPDGKLVDRSARDAAETAADIHAAAVVRRWHEIRRAVKP